MYYSFERRNGETQLLVALVSRKDTKTRSKTSDDTKQWTEVTWVVHRYVRSFSVVVFTDEQICLCDNMRWFIKTFTKLTWIRAYLCACTIDVHMDFCDHKCSQRLPWYVPSHHSPTPGRLSEQLVVPKTNRYRAQALWHRYLNTVKI